MRYGNPGYLRDLSPSGSFWLLAALSPDGKGFSQKATGPLSRLTFRGPNAKLVQQVISGKIEPILHETTPDVILASLLATEIRTPGTYTGASLIFASTAGNLPRIQSIIQQIGGITNDSNLLHPMIVTATEHNRPAILSFCLSLAPSTPLSDDITFAAFCSRSANIFRLLFPKNLFTTQQHPEYLDLLLEDSCWAGQFEPPHDPAAMPRGAVLLSF